MKRNVDLMNLAAIMMKCNELNLPCEPAIRHYGECIEEMVDNAMIIIQRLIDKPYNRCSRMTLVIDFEKMMDADYWTSSRIFCLLSKEKGKQLKEKLEMMANMLRVLCLKMKQIDLEYAENLLKRMEARCMKKHQIFDYDIWKASHPNYTLDMLHDKEVEFTANLLKNGLLAYDEMPTEEELEAVRLDMVRKHLKHNTSLPEGFENECAKLRRYSHWEDKYLFVIDYPRIYRYLFINCFEKFNIKQRWALYEYDMQMQMIHQDIRKLMSTRPPADDETTGKDIVQDLKPLFYNNEDNVKLFLKEIDGMPPNDITDLVNQWVKDDRISDYGNSRKGGLWRVLNDAGLYDKSRQNWNRRVF